MARKWQEPFFYRILGSIIITSKKQHLVLRNNSIFFFNIFRLKNRLQSRRNCSLVQLGNLNFPFALYGEERTYIKHKLGTIIFKYIPSYMVLDDWIHGKRHLQFLFVEESTSFGEQFRIQNHDVSGYYEIILHLTDTPPFCILVKLTP